MSYHAQNSPLIEAYPVQNVNTPAFVKLSPRCRSSTMLLCVSSFPLNVLPSGDKNYNLVLVVLSGIMEKLITTTSFEQLDAVKLTHILIAQGNDSETKESHCPTYCPFWSDSHQRKLLRPAKQWHLVWQRTAAQPGKREFRAEQHEKCVLRNPWNKLQDTPHITRR